jgi:hypothetical protein
MLLVSLLSFLGCKDEEEIFYTQFNAKDDVISIEVGAVEELPPTTIDLHSSTGQVIVGSATVTPGGGPIGTTHVLTVEVLDDWEDQVPRVTVRTDSGNRGEDEYELTTDSADEGLHQIKLVSFGDEGESRTDIFTIRLWEIDGQVIETYDTSIPEEEAGSGQ